MADHYRGGLFSSRNILGTALVAGIGLGIYLGQFKGLGWGGNGSSGTLQTTTAGSAGESDKKTIDESERTKTVKPLDDEKNAIPNVVTDVVKVLIDDRSFYVRSKNEDLLIELPQLMKLVKAAPGDADGIRIRIYEKSTARTSAEEKLKDALTSNEIPDDAVLWVPPSVK